MEIYIIPKNGEVVTTHRVEGKTLKQLEADLGRPKDTFTKAELRTMQAKVHVYLGDEDITQDVLRLIEQGKYATSIDKEHYSLQKKPPTQTAYKVTENSSKINEGVVLHQSFAEQIQRRREEQRATQHALESLMTDLNPDADCPLMQSRRNNIEKKQGRHTNSDSKYTGVAI